MINRILIRIKVVQILYAYLLSRSEFKIITKPSGASRDSQFAYAVYLDVLYILQELSGIAINNPARALRATEVHPKLAANRVGRALADNIELKAISFKNISHLNTLAPALQPIADAIAESEYFKEYSRKRSRSLDDDVKMWTVMLSTVILKDRRLADLLRQCQDFSLAGFNAGVQMAIDTLAQYNDYRAAYLKARQDLAASLDKAYELYFGIFDLMIQLTDAEAERIETARNKYLASADELNPDTRFVNNPFIEALRQNPQLQEFIEKHPTTWAANPALLRQLGEAIRCSDAYRVYMQAPEVDWKTSCELWRDLVRTVIVPSDALAETLESSSVFWNDDLEIMSTFVLKTLRHFAQASPEAMVKFLPQFKDEEDAAFGEKLFTCAVQNRETYREYIDKFISNGWDPERLAFMDIVIMIVALAEILNFPGIPIAVSLNEYIEIANSYSTPRSGPFINGILYSVIDMLAQEGLLGKPFASTRK